MALVSFLLMLYLGLSFAQMDFRVENPGGSESQDAAPGAGVLWDVIVCPSPILLGMATPSELPGLTPLKTPETGCTIPVTREGSRCQWVFY